MKGSAYLQSCIRPADVLGTEDNTSWFECLEFVHDEFGSLREDGLVRIGEENDFALVILVTGEILSKNIHFLRTARPFLSDSVDLNDAPSYSFHPDEHL